MCVYVCVPLCIIINIIIIIIIIFINVIVFKMILVKNKNYCSNLRYLTILINSVIYEWNIKYIVRYVHSSCVAIL